MPNARLSERAPFFAEVDVLAAGAPAPRRVWGGDVSETGIFLQTTHPFRVGDRVSLRFDVHSHEVHVRAAEVMWVRPFDAVSVDGRTPGVGLKFVAVDPPARAALRRFIQPRCGDAGDVTLPESDPVALASLPPPATSLPPATDSILARARGGERRIAEITDEMFAVSLPPFSQPPLHISLPPDEPSLIPGDVRVFAQTLPMGTPRPVTMLPGGPAGARDRRCRSNRSDMHMSDMHMSDRKASTPPSPLAGWSFRRDEIEDEPSIDESEHGGAATLGRDVGLDLRFDDEAPLGSAVGGAVSGAPSASSLPPDESSLFDITSLPPEAVCRDGRAEPRPGEPVDDAPARAFEEGLLALRQLPVAEERQTSPARRPTRVPQRAGARIERSRALPVALGLLCAGTLVGVGIGLAGKELQRPGPAAPVVAAAPAPVAARAAATQTRSVADIEKELVPPAAPPPATTLASVVAPAPAPLPVSSPASPPVAAPAAGPAEPARSAAAAEASPTDGASFALQVGEARVLKAFTLTSPSRVVVDLEGATLPKQALTPGGRVTRVRFGTPAPGTSRVVLELVDEARAKDLEATVRDGLLSVHFL